MVSWPVTARLTLVIAGVSMILLIDGLEYLGGYWGLILSDYG